MLPVPTFTPDRRRSVPVVPRGLKDPFSSLAYTDIAREHGSSPVRTAFLGKQAMKRLAQMFGGTAPLGELCVQLDVQTNTHFGYLADGVDRTEGVPNAYGDECPLKACWLAVCGELQMREECRSVGEHFGLAPKGAPND